MASDAASTVLDAPRPPFPHYRAQGTPRELGRQHGEQARDRIRAHLDFLRTSLQLSDEIIKERSLAFLPLFERHCPRLLPELEGLAEGAQIEFADALAVNIRGALGVAPDGCTSFVVSGRGTANGEILIGQNSDMLPAMIDLAYVLHLQPIDQPSMLMWTFGGMIGYHGINSEGVAHFANDLGGGPPPRFGMPHYPVKRMMLERRSLKEVVPLLEGVPFAVNGNYVLCDGQGEILDVEATTEGCHLVHDAGDGFIAHSNHFLCERHATEENHRQSAADSFPRLTRMRQLIQSRFGELSVDDFKKFLRDRDGGAAGICRSARSNNPAEGWETAGITAASLIAEPARGRLHIAPGNKADAVFTVYEMS